MKALVTGAGGFVGHHLITHLQNSGDDVVASDSRHGGADITDYAALRAEIAGSGVEVIYHLAGWSDVGASWDHPEDTFRANAGGTLNVLRAARDVGVRRVIAISSADVYGKAAPEDMPLTEESPLRPVSPYAVSKVAADYLALQAWLGHGQEVIRVRAFNHLGPGQTDKFVASALASRIVKARTEGQTEILVGNMSARRDYTDVRDVVRAYRSLALSGRPGEAYNVCSGVDVSVAEVAEMLLATSGVQLELKIDPNLLRPVDLPVHRGSFEKLASHTGWRPEFALRQTLSDLLADWSHRQ